MSELLTRRAFDAYQAGDFIKARAFYRQLAALLGEKLFRANLKLVEKRIALFHPGTIPISKVAPATIELPNTSGNALLTLSDEPIWCQFYLSDSDFVLVATDIAYERISDGSGRHAYAIVEFLDSAESLIAGPYSNLSQSEKGDWFSYVSPPEYGGASFALTPPSGAASVRIGFRSHCVNPPQRVLMSRSVRLRVHDNNPVEKVETRTVSKLPTLPALPFETAVFREKSRLKVASVLDKFSHACFEPECDLIPITPSRWREELIDHHVDMVLVESAWHGNDDAWLYRIAKYPTPPGNELSPLLRWARKLGVPTVFWNKEDPPNFDRFIDRASEFDYIFTTDENCIERYRDRVPASTHVASLPFAAQPQIHNPRLDQPRISATSFAGTYYADDYVQRRNAMNVLLRTAARYGLDIFDRMHDVAGKDKERFTFPLDLQKYIHGSLAYNDMLKAYRRYRVGLNVNSVSDSPTMFSRRVFELLACGTPVVSTESIGIDRIFGGLVPTVESEEEAVHVLNKLMLDPAHWLNTSALGLRAVFKSHTYAHRLQRIAEVVGLQAPCEAVPALVVVILPRGDVNRFMLSMQHQHLSAAKFIVSGARYSDKEAQSHVSMMRAAGLNAVALPSANIATYIRHRYPAAAVAVCDSRHYYGPGYLLDAAIALQGAPKGSASTILPDMDHVPNTQTANFEAVARLGMPTKRLHAGTLIVHNDNSLLMEALAFGQDQDVYEINPPGLRTRAGFDFTSRNALDAGQEATQNDLQ